MNGAGQAPDGVSGEPKQPASVKRAGKNPRRKALLAGAAVLAVALGAFFLSSMGAGADGEEKAAGTANIPAADPSAPAGDSPETEESAEIGHGEAEDPPPPVPEDETEEGGAPPASDADLAARDREVAVPVSITDGTSTSGVAEVRVTRMEAVDGEARGIGEIAGPALRFTLSITNSTSEPIDLGAAVVVVETGTSKSPATELSGPGIVPFPATVEPGQTASGIFVFLIPVENRDQVSVYLNYSVDVPMAAFTGAVPKP